MLPLSRDGTRYGEEVARQIIQTCPGGQDGFVVEIGSNDGVMLKGDHGQGTPVPGERRSVDLVRTEGPSGVMAVGPRLPRAGLLTRLTLQNSSI